MPNVILRKSAVSDFRKLFENAGIPKQTIENFIGMESQFPGTLETIARTGQYPKEVENYYLEQSRTGETPQRRQGAMAVLNRVYELPPIRDIHKKFVEKVKTSADAADDDDLRIAKEASLELQGGMKEWTGTSAESIASEIRQKIAPIIDTTTEQVQKSIRSAAETIAKNDRSNPGRILDLAVSQLPAPGVGTQQKLKDVLSPLVTDTVSGKYDTQKLTKEGEELASGVGNIDEIIAQRAKKAEAEKDVGEYLGALPDELTKSREEYLGGETERAKQKFEQEYVPQAMEMANVRGGLFSGDVQDYLTTGAIDFQSQIDEARATLESEDNQFYANAAYSNMVRRSLEANVGLRNFIQNERAGALTSQDERFLSTQGDLNRRFNERIATKDYERSLASNEAKLKRERDAYDREKRAQQYGQIGKYGGMIAGGFAGGVASGGNPAGIQMGTQMGGVVGEDVVRSVT